MKQTFSMGGSTKAKERISVKVKYDCLLNEGWGVGGGHNIYQLPPPTSPPSPTPTFDLPPANPHSNPNLNLNPKPPRRLRWG